MADFGERKGVLRGKEVFEDLDLGFEDDFMDSDVYVDSTNLGYELDADDAEGGMLPEDIEDVVNRDALERSMRRYTSCACDEGGESNVDLDGLFEEDLEW